MKHLRIGLVLLAMTLMAAKCSEEKQDPDKKPLSVVNLQVNPQTVFDPPPPSVRIDTFWRVVNGDSLMALVEVPVCPPPPVVDTAAIRTAFEAELRALILSEIDTAAIYALRPPDTVERIVTVIQPVDSAAIRAEVECPTCPPPVVVDTAAIQALKICEVCPEPVDCPECPEPDPDPDPQIQDEDWLPDNEPWWPEGDWNFAQEDSIINARFNFVMDSIGVDVNPNDNGVQYISWSTANWFRWRDMTGQGVHSHIATDSTFAWWYERPPTGYDHPDSDMFVWNWQDSKGLWVEDKYSVGISEGDYTVMFWLGWFEGDRSVITPGDKLFIVVKDGQTKIYVNAEEVDPSTLPFTVSSSEPQSDDGLPFVGNITQFAYWKKALTPRGMWRMGKMAGIYESKAPVRQ